MARQPVALFALLLFTAATLLVTDVLAQGINPAEVMSSLDAAKSSGGDANINGELPTDDKSAPPSLPPESFGDVIGSDESDAAPDAAPMGSTSDDGMDVATGPPTADATGSTDGSSPTSAPADKKNASGASTIKQTSVAASVAVVAGFFAF